MYAFDDVLVKVLKPTKAKTVISIFIVTTYATNLLIFAESLEEAKNTLGNIVFIKCPKVEIKAGKVQVINISRYGKNIQPTAIINKNKFTMKPQKIFLLVICISIFFSGFLFSASAQTSITFSTDYLKININKNGFIDQFVNTTSSAKSNFSPADKPSPLLSLYNTKQQKYFYPKESKYNSSKKLITIKYDNGSVATIKIEPKQKYIKFTLKSLSPRNGIDVVEWGTYHTTITNLFGEMIGVARDTSEAVNFAIGLLALNDATTSGPATTIGDMGPFEYVVHSPDKEKIMLPDNLKEGMVSVIGGNGINDGDFYSHPEPYWRILYGNGASIDEEGRVSVSYHSSDRRKAQTIFFSLMPEKQSNLQRHQEILPLPDVDFIGSSVALWAGPDNLGLNIIENIVLAEGLPHPTIAGKWVKDPASFKPDLIWYGNAYDSALSYAKQLGFKSIQGESLGEFYVNRGNAGHLNLKVPMDNGSKISIKEFTTLCDKENISFGLHTLNNFLQFGISNDVSPKPSDSLEYLLKRVLVKNINASDTIIIIDNNKYMEEVGGWEGNHEEVNMVKIGKELIHYNGISTEAPYTLKNVIRGYENTIASAHNKTDLVYKLQTNCYNGLVPNIYLQDEMAAYYAQLSAVNGMRYIDFDGEEGFFYQGHGNYAVKRFFRKFFQDLKNKGIEDMRVMGATVSEGSWHYHSVYNVGGGYNVSKRTWGISTKDMRNVCYANYLPITFGGVSSIDKNCSVQDWENLEAVSVGLGTTYYWSLSKKSVESCPLKYPIFHAVRTWENARTGNAFPTAIKKIIADETRQFHLEEVDKNTWNLYEVKASGNILLATLKSL